jgi:hypothetical protein
MEWRLVVVNQVPFHIMHNAFSWYHNIGDALHHFAHYGSFLSETHREEAVKVLGAMSKPPTMFEKELTELKYYIDHAPINPNKPTITTIC